MSRAGRAAWERIPATALPLALILCAQLGLGAGFARHTPPWQAPDEPAHYNYIAHVADAAASSAGWPSISPEDYPADKVARVMAREIGPETDLGDLRYEDHQPPLYYWLASWVYRLPSRSDATDTGAEAARLLALRLTGTLLTLVTTTLTWTWVRLGWPDEPALALAAAGFTAFLPMHAAIGASVNNDVLALPLMAAVLVVTLAHATARIDERRLRWLGGGLLGAAFLTKLTVYVAALPLALAAWLPARRGRRLRVLAASSPVWIGMALAAPWWLRNAAVYGWRDPLALAAHAVAVQPQPTTAAFVAEFGWTALMRRAVVFTFDSFWGVYGWMSVFLPAWVYSGLALACCVSAAGLWRHGRARRSAPRARPDHRDGEWAAWRLGSITAIGSLCAFLAYNLHFVQHQGRYLFPALLPLAAGATLGARTATGGRPGDRRHRWTRLRTGLGLALWPAGLLLLGWWSVLRYVLPGLLVST
jgi:4-amino-4-deoxy-L-arabinose transferase-like glycosyltransferase